MANPCQPREPWGPDARHSGETLGTGVPTMARFFARSFVGLSAPIVPTREEIERAEFGVEQTED